MSVWEDEVLLRWAKTLALLYLFPYQLISAGHQVMSGVMIFGLILKLKG